MRVPWTARRSSQVISREVNPEYSLEGLTLKLQYFGHLKVVKTGDVELWEQGLHRWRADCAFSTGWRGVPLIPMLFKGQLYLMRS